MAFTKINIQKYIHEEDDWCEGPNSDDAIEIDADLKELKILSKALKEIIESNQKETIIDSNNGLSMESMPLKIKFVSEDEFKDIEEGILKIKVTIEDGFAVIIGPYEGLELLMLLIDEMIETYQDCEERVCIGMYFEAGLLSIYQSVTIQAYAFINYVY